MKKVLYSYFTKIIAAILLVCCVVSAVVISVEDLKQANENEVYSFESAYSESNYFTGDLTALELIVYNAYIDSANLDADRVYSLSEDKYYPVEELQFSQIVTFMLEQKLANSEKLEKLDYYIMWGNDRIFTNCGATSAMDLQDQPFYYRVDRNTNGTINRYGNGLVGGIVDDIYSVFYRFENFPTPFVIAASVKQSCADEVEKVWQQEKAMVEGILAKAAILLAVALVLLCYLLIVCGKNRHGETKYSWIDRICLEIQVGIVVFIGYFTTVIGLRFMGYFLSEKLSSIVLWGLGICVATISAMLLSLLLSVARDIKNHRLKKSLLSYQIIATIGKQIVRIFRQLRFALSKKYSAVLLGMLVVYTVLIAFCSIFLPYSPVWFLLDGILLVLAAWIVSCRARDMSQLKEGIQHIRQGDMTYKIPELKAGDLKTAAENLNEISKGMDAAVVAKVRAERMKSELITNVSHDLKTPITSIITYTELLGKVEDMPEAGLDYACIISQKAYRLKKLTQDLFDISKAQSGNEQILLERLDVALLLSQSLGELDGEIQRSNLTFCVNLPKELYIQADGRKMSRVVSNLLHNILKYSMKQTRVFISAIEKDGQAVLEFKNISAYPMNFEAQDIVGRFVRGDESRTTEGNGLGLAIAKSYTELCGGKLEIVIDGDMFKALLYFPIDRGSTNS